MLHLRDGIVIEFSEGNDAYVLMDLDEGKVYKLNSTAHIMLSSIENTGSLQQYYDEVRDQADDQTIRRDASDYLNELISKGYVIDE